MHSPLLNPAFIMVQRGPAAPFPPMSQPIITLYDLPSQSHMHQPWAPNIWPVRFLLNYKRLHYRTVLIDFSDVEATMRSIGAPPSSLRGDGRPVYSLPVIVDPARSPTVILSNTTTIVEYLEAQYPARPVFPEGSRTVQSVFVHYIQEAIIKPLLPVMLSSSYHRMPDQAQSHFRSRSTQSPAPGMSSHTLAGPQREQAWAAVKDRFDTLAGFMDKNSGSDGNGVVVQGHHVTYADFALCSVLIWIERMAPHDGWPRVRQWNGGRWARLWDACRDWMDVL